MSSGKCLFVQASQTPALRDNFLMADVFYNQHLIALRQGFGRRVRCSVTPEQSAAPAGSFGEVWSRRRRTSNPPPKASNENANDENPGLFISSPLAEGFAGPSLRSLNERLCFKNTNLLQARDFLHVVPGR